MFMFSTGSRHPQAGPTGPGDVGRRVAHRREQLGLSAAEVADRAGMAANYIEYLESCPDTVETGTVTRLAGALDTSVRYLLGGGLDGPPGQGAPAAVPVLAELEPWECWAKLAPGGVGRVALTTPDGPRVIPVNYRTLDGAVLYRTRAGSTPARALGHTVAFEVDHLDEALSHGWSVLLVGPARQVTEAESVVWFGRHADPRPWVGDEARDTWVRISPRSITGRVIRADGPGAAGRRP